ncbi:MAG TPA: hypothetical protein VK188_09010 [Holophaga sp.]|nr:hypothetical protein [Holophaga sp.]
MPSWLMTLPEAELRRTLVLAGFRLEGDGARLEADPGVRVAWTREADLALGALRLARFRVELDPSGRGEPEARVLASWFLAWFQKGGG